jgi:hypothetical protein
MNFVKPTSNGMGIKFGFFEEDEDGRELEYNSATEYYDHIMESYFRDFKRGFEQTSKAKIEIEDIENGVRIVTDKENIKNISGVSVNSVKGFSPYQYGVIMAEAYMRPNDTDPEVRNTFYEEDESTGKYEKFDKNRLIEWIVTKKLARDSVEWRKINQLDHVDREKELDSIAYLVARSIFEGKK